jgi:hypothetical protein
MKISRNGVILWFGKRVGIAGGDRVGWGVYNGDLERSKSFIIYLPKKVTHFYYKV